MARIPLSFNRPRSENIDAPQRIYAQRALAEDELHRRRGEFDHEVDLTAEAWQGVTQLSRPETETDIEVLERIPWAQQRLLQSKWLGRLASPYYRNNSFGLLEYSTGEEQGDRRYQRYVVAKRMKGVVLPHVVRTDDRGRKRLPDARIPSEPEAKRRDALVLGNDKQSSWTGALHANGRKAVAVGRDIGVIGVDNRPLRRPLLSERLQESLLDSFGIDRRRRPNDAARGLQALIGAESAAQARDSANTLRDVRKKLTAIGHHALFLSLQDQGLIDPHAPAPVLPPHPHDRRKPHWQGWGDNDRNRQERPYKYRGF